VAVCHPDAVSLENVTLATLVPFAFHRYPVWVPVFDEPL
jgi:hypothetical protein